MYMASKLRHIAVLALGLFIALPTASVAEVLDRIIAVVDEGVILQSELDRELRYAMVQLKARGINVPDPEVLRTQVLERLIVTRVQTMRAKKSGIRVDDRELNEVLGGIAKQNKLSLSQFAQTIRDEGGDYLAVREQVREEVITTRLRQREVDSRVVVTDRDIELFLAGQTQADDDTQYRLSHILIAVPDGATPDERQAARAKATKLLNEIEEGGDFAQLAVANSDGQQALRGGDLDWRGAENLPLNFLHAARKLSPGGVSPALETSAGFHIIKLVDSRGGEERKRVDETKARHILIQTSTIRDEDQARLLARDLHQRIVGGEDFAKLAMEFSDDGGSKNSGGDLGWTPPGVFVPEFQAEVDQLKKDEISNPIRTQFGWHIIQVLDRRTRDVTKESQRARARGAIHNRKAAEEYDTWLRRLRAEAYVEYRGTGDTAKEAESEVLSDETS